MSLSLISISEYLRRSEMNESRAKLEIVVHLSYLLVPGTEHHLSSFECSFLTIFLLQNLLRSFCYGGTNMARKNV